MKDLITLFLNDVRAALPKDHHEWELLIAKLTFTGWFAMECAHKLYTVFADYFLK